MAITKSEVLRRKYVDTEVGLKTHVRNKLQQENIPYVK